MQALQFELHNINTTQKRAIEALAIETANTNAVQTPKIVSLEAAIPTLQNTLQALNQSHNDLLATTSQNTARANIGAQESLSVSQVIGWSMLTSLLVVLANNGILATVWCKLWRYCPSRREDKQRNSKYIRS